MNCGICGLPGADMTGWVYPAHGDPDEGHEAPVHRSCTEHPDKEDQEKVDVEG